MNNIIQQGKYNNINLNSYIFIPKRINMFYIIIDVTSDNNFIINELYFYGDLNLFFFKMINNIYIDNKIDILYSVYPIVNPFDTLKSIDNRKIYCCNSIKIIYFFTGFNNSGANFSTMINITPFTTQNFNISMEWNKQL